MAIDLNAQYALYRLSPEGLNYFFGYYDLQPESGDGKKYLAHKPPFINRVQQKGDMVEIGYFPLEAPGEPFVPVAETGAWNFQQGAMLQWHPAFPDRKIIFNSEGADGYRGVIRDLETGSENLLDQPVATVAPDGLLSLSINFARMYTFRPGYGYAGIDDPWAGVNMPDDDGIYLVDLESGRAPLLLSLKTIWESTRQASEPDEEHPKILVNHITWNPSSTRFVFLLRYMSSRNGGWRTSVMTADRNGRNIKVLIPFGYASHYWWLNDEELLFHSEGSGRGDPGLYVINAVTGEFTPVNPRVFIRDVHCSTLPGSPVILNDTYPIPETENLPPDYQGLPPAYRHLFLYDRSTETTLPLGRFYSPPHITGDFRCDLHPRWSRDGRGFSFDSVHEGFRGIYRVRFKD